MSRTIIQEQTLYYHGHTASKVKLHKGELKTVIAQRATVSSNLRLPKHLFKTSPRDAAVPAVNATFNGQVAGMTTDVLITANVAGIIGNDIELVFDGIKTIAAVISEWNTANADNHCTLTTGTGTQIPNNVEVIALTDGADYIANTVAPESKASVKAPKVKQTNAVKAKTVAPKKVAPKPTKRISKNK